MNTIQFEIPLTWMRVKTAAAYLGLSTNTINRLRRSGRIPCYRLNEKTILYARQDLDDFASKQITLFIPNRTATPDPEPQDND